MNRRRVIMLTVLLVGILVLGAFIGFGLPLIQDMFTTPIPGLPTVVVGNSLQARYTQTALAKQSPVNPSATPAVGAK